MDKFIRPVCAGAHWNSNGVREESLCRNTSYLLIPFFREKVQGFKQSLISSRFACSKRAPFSTWGNFETLNSPPSTIFQVGYMQMTRKIDFRSIAHDTRKTFKIPFAGHQLFHRPSSGIFIHHHHATYVLTDGAQLLTISLSLDQTSSEEDVGLIKFWRHPTICQLSGSRSRVPESRPGVETRSPSASTKVTTLWVSVR